MNLGELRQAVDRRSGVAFSTAALNDLVNEALAKLTLAADWPWLWSTYTFTATTDDGDQALPVTFRRVESVTIDGYEAHVASPQIIDAWDNLYSSDRRSYTVRGGTLSFRPTQTTGTSISVRYIAAEARLEDDADEPLLPEQYHDALIDLAAGLALERTGNLTRARLLTDRFNEWAVGMKRTALRVGGNAGRIHVRPGSAI